MTRGQGSLCLATRKGIQVLGLRLIAAATPAPTWRAHDSAGALTAAWLTLRGRTYLGPREIFDGERPAVTALKVTARGPAVGWPSSESVRWL